MQFIYTPEGGDTKRWDFVPGKIMNVEAEVIEKHTGVPFREFTPLVVSGSMRALHALLFVFLKREIPTLTYDAVRFTLSEVGIEFNDEDEDNMIAGLEAKRDEVGLEPEEETALAVLIAKRADRPNAPAAAAPGEDPKD